MSITALFNRMPRQITAEEIVRIQVAKRIEEKVLPTRLSQAQARAERLVWGGAQMQTAIDRAVYWALSAD